MSRLYMSSVNHLEKIDQSWCTKSEALFFYPVSLTFLRVEHHPQNAKNWLFHFATRFKENMYFGQSNRVTKFLMKPKAGENVLFSPPELATYTPPSSILSAFIISLLCTIYYGKCWAQSIKVNNRYLHITELEERDKQINNLNKFNGTRQIPLATWTKGELQYTLGLVRLLYNWRLEEISLEWQLLNHQWITVNSCCLWSYSLQSCCEQHVSTH